MAYRVPGDTDLLSVINDSPGANIFTQIAVYVYPFAGITTSIPIFSIIIRYNLLETEICSKRTLSFAYSSTSIPCLILSLSHSAWALFWSIVFPWLVIVPFYTGSGLLTLINWASLIFW